jgi:TonB-dependent SusC/RagA subfamily outer membrane receptor
MIAVAAAAAEGQAQPAQQATVTGQVTVSGTGQPLGAVQVFIPSLNVGTQTRDDGRFSFAVPARAVGTTVTVTARRLGYRSVSQTVALRAGAVDVNFTVEAAPTQLTGVVVSALSVQREKATIGTSQQQVSGAELIKTRDPNVVNSLSGKVSGVQINAGGAIGGSSRIVIRGNNSINGNNQPLFIVDGTPVSNANVTNSTQAAGNGGIDYGNAIRDLNPDDIASLTVLKGPNAAALYGSRAANGAIVITTKSGRTAGQGVQATANSYTTFETPMRLPSYQNVYGQGSAGQFKFVDGAGGGVQDGNDQSFGPRLDGRLIDQFTGKQQPWVAQPNNVADFFNLGRTFQNNVAISANAAGAAARISVANEQVAGIVPGSRLNKTTASVNGEARFQDRLTTNASVQYVRNQGFNRPGTGYNAGILEQFVWFGRQVDINALRARRYNDDGSLYNWNYNYHNNPYWLMYDNPNRDQRDRVIGSAQAQYKVLPWLTGTLRSGLDTYRENRDQNFAAGNLSAAIGNFAANGGAGVGNGVDPNYAGGFDFYNRRESEYNTEGSSPRRHARPLRPERPRRRQSAPQPVHVRQPVHHRPLGRRDLQRVERGGDAHAVPAHRAPRHQLGVRPVSATFNKFWTVDVTGRNDWSSTLPTTTNSYFYPSVSSSLVLTTCCRPSRRGPLGFMKLRGSIASVGNDADPYQLQSVFLGQANKFGSQPQYTLGNTIANPNLKPERTTSSEGGVEVGLFDNRLTLDATYYSRRTDDQIINLQISNTTGFNAKAINAGRVTNKGVEALLTAIPIRTARGFTWTSTVNFTTNRNKVVTLAPGLSTVVLGTSWSVNVEAREGEQYGAIVGAPFLRDSATGQLLLSARGTPLPDNANRRVLGNFNPDWLGGWNNEFRYKGATLSALIDVRKGGDVFSVTNMFGTYAGVLSSTVNGRENDWNDPGILVPGLARATGQPNTVRASAERYYQSLYGIHEAFVYDAGFVKLREVRLGYDLPRSLLGRARVRSANVAFVGRNLLMRTNVPNIDPESALSTGNVQGLEFATLPTARSIGFNITVTP